MPVVERIAGPGVTPNDIELELPPSWDSAEFARLADIIVLQTKRHASDTFRAMLAVTPNAVTLADEFAKRLGL